MAKGKYEITAIAYDKRGRILSVGKNNYLKTHPLQAKFSKNTSNPHRKHIHAELAALLAARGKVHKLVVTRFDAMGNPATAKPCDACQKAIAYFGVKVVEWTESNKG